MTGPADLRLASTSALPIVVALNMYICQTELTETVRVDHQQAPITLRAGAAECEIWPAAGGSIARLTIGTQEMFRRALTAAPEGSLPLHMASFPLVPYSNRIGFGRFALGGEAIQLEANFPPEPHAIHGTGWTAAWEIASATDSSVVLRHSHQRDAHWPWPFEAEQHIALLNDMLTIEMVARNLSDHVVPLAMGHHPYFDSEAASLSFRAVDVWHTGEDGLPSHTGIPDGAFDFAEGGQVKGRALDNCFAGWDGNARISWDRRPLSLDITSNMEAAVVYVPKGEGYFCFEPVPHIINALNLPDYRPQMPLVAPGARFESHIRFKARPS